MHATTVHHTYQMRRQEFITLVGTRFITTRPCSPRPLGKSYRRRGGDGSNPNGGEDFSGRGDHDHSGTRWAQPGRNPGVMLGAARGDTTGLPHVDSLGARCCCGLLLLLE